MFHKTFHFILDIIFPKKKSTVMLEEIASGVGLRTLAPAPATPHSFIHAIFHYKDPLARALVWEIKYSANPILTEEAGKLMAEEIMSFFEERGLFISRDWILIPIPASKIHLKERGFNQTDILARNILKHLPKDTIHYKPSAIIKIKETEPQAKIKNKRKRLQNLKGVFKVTNHEDVYGKNVIVIDDVVTTGSTLTEARRALKEAGAKQVIAIALAH